jgi:hypothetical protein
MLNGAADDPDRPHRFGNSSTIASRGWSGQTRRKPHCAAAQARTIGAMVPNLAARPLTAGLNGVPLSKAASI